MEGAVDRVIPSGAIGRVKEAGQRLVLKVLLPMQSVDFGLFAKAAVRDQIDSLLFQCSKEDRIVVEQASCGAPRVIQQRIRFQSGQGMKLDCIAPVNRGVIGVIGENCECQIRVRVPLVTTQQVVIVICPA